MYFEKNDCQSLQKSRPAGSYDRQHTGAMPGRVTSIIGSAGTRLFSTQGKKGKLYYFADGIMAIIICLLVPCDTHCFIDSSGSLAPLGCSPAAALCASLSPSTLPLAMSDFTPPGRGVKC